MESPEKDFADTFWAREPWWQDPQYLKHFPGSVDQLLVAVEEMQRHFDRKWWETLTTGCGNIVRARLIATGLWPLFFINNLGTDLHQLRNAQGVQGKINDLKGSKSRSALHEVQVAGVLAEAGLLISFPKEGRERSPDILVTVAEGSAAVECKQLEPQEWEAWANRVAIGVLRHSPQAKNARVEIALAPDLSNIRMEEKKAAGWNAAITEALIREMKEALVYALNEVREPEFRIELPGIARISVQRDAEKPEFSATGIPHSPAAELRRVLTEGLFQATGQMPPGTPGIVVVKCEYPVGEALARAAFETAISIKAGDMAGVGALIIVPAQQVSKDPEGQLLVNENCDMNAAGRKALEALKRAYCRPTDSTPHGIQERRPKLNWLPRSIAD